jgi:hypothetical protein
MELILVGAFFKSIDIVGQSTDFVSNRCQIGQAAHSYHITSAIDQDYCVGFWSAVLVPRDAVGIT